MGRYARILKEEGMEIAVSLIILLYFLFEFALFFTPFELSSLPIYFNYFYLEFTILTLLAYEVLPDILKGFDPAIEEDFFKNNRGLNLLAVMAIVPYILLQLKLYEIDEGAPFVDGLLASLPAEDGLLLISILLLTFFWGELVGIFIFRVASKEDLDRISTNFFRTLKPEVGETERKGLMDTLERERLSLQNLVSLYTWQLSFGGIVVATVFVLSFVIVQIMAMDYMELIIPIVWVAYSTLSGGLRGSKKEIIKNVASEVEKPEELVFDIQTSKFGLKGLIVVMFLFIAGIRLSLLILRETYTLFMEGIGLVGAIAQYVNTYVANFGLTPLIVNMDFPPLYAASLVIVTSAILLTAIFGIYVFQIWYVLMQRLHYWVEDLDGDIDETVTVLTLPSHSTLYYPFIFVSYLLAGRLDTLLTEQTGIRIFALLAALFLALLLVYVYVVLVARRTVTDEEIPRNELRSDNYLIIYFALISIIVPSVFKWGAPVALSLLGAGLTMYYFWPDVQLSLGSRIDSSLLYVSLINLYLLAIMLLILLSAFLVNGEYATVLYLLPVAALVSLGGGLFDRAYGYSD